VSDDRCGSLLFSCRRGVFLNQTKPRLGRRRIVACKGKPMWDFIVVAIGVVSFGLFYAYALGCDRL
jgi:hypothetical protein